MSRNDTLTASWTQDPNLDQIDFARDILPHLADIPLSAMAETTGLSESYCSFICRGIKTSHRRHWTVLAELGGRQPGAPRLE